jgi:hypothetical protein
MAFQCKSNEVLLQNVRLSFVHLLEPYTNPNQVGEPKYSAMILVPKSDVAQAQAIQQAIEATIADARVKHGAKVPAQPKTPIHDGDGYTPGGKTYGPECKGHYVFNASQSMKFKPEVVDLQGNRLTEPGQVYSGMYANILVNFYFYNNQSSGISAGLGPIQKVRDGEPLGGGQPASAASVFGAPQGSAANVFGGADAVAQPVNPLTGQPL